MAKPAPDKAQQNRLLLLLAVLVVVAVIAIVKGFGGSRLAGPGSSGTELSYARKNLPTLVAVEPESEPGEDVGVHRNPFTFGKPPTPTPNLTPKPTQPPRVRPSPRARPTSTPTPIGYKGPPPPFNRAYIGNFGPERLPVAVFRKQTEDPEIALVEVAVVGDILDGDNDQPIFIIREIGYESVLIGFVGWDSSEDRRVSLSEE